jgi:hypothetical protein
VSFRMFGISVTDAVTAVTCARQIYQAYFDLQNGPGELVEVHSQFILVSRSNCLQVPRRWLSLEADSNQRRDMRTSLRRSSISKAC